MEVWRTTNHTSLGSLFLCCGTTEPAHEIMVLFVFHKRILQTPMHSHPGGLDVYFWSDPSSTSILHMCEQQRLWRDCAGSPETSLVAYVISTIISWAGSIIGSQQLMVLQCCFSFESHDKTNIMTCAQRRLRSAWATAQSDQSSLGTIWVAKDPMFLNADIKL